MSKYNISNDDNYATPKELYSELDREFKFDFDPCPYFEGDIIDENDGLMKEWGNVNFINPPYSKPLKDLFVKKAIEQSKLGKTCVVLIPVVTSSKLFHDHIKPNAKEIRFLRGRVKFEKLDPLTKEFKSSGAGRHDSMIVVFKAKKHEENKI